MIKTSDTLKNVAVWLAVAAGSTYYVMSNESDRIYPSVTKIDREISAVKAQIIKIQQQPDLPPLNKTWAKAKSIANQYGVVLKPLPSSKDARINKANLPGGKAWYGVLQGKTKQVAIAGIEIQKRFPVLFGYSVIKSDSMGLSLAVLGNES